MERESKKMCDIGMRTWWRDQQKYEESFGDRNYGVYT